jgi:putative ABC transport system ATP-binding protein
VSVDIPAIEARGLSRSFERDGRVLHALRGVELSIARGEHVAIVGRSGAGKSTLLNLIGALDRGYQGSLRVFGQELRSLPDGALSRFRNRQIGFVFQNFNLLSGLSVGDNVMLPASFGAPLDHATVRQRAMALLDQMGLADRFDQAPNQLSGGERQRVAIARALLLQPPLLVCDEPTGSLDLDTAAQILGTLQDLQQRHGATLVVVTHDPAVAAAADRVIRLEGGTVVEAGKAVETGSMVQGDAAPTGPALPAREGA